MLQPLAAKWKGGAKFDADLHPRHLVRRLAVLKGATRSETQGMSIVLDLEGMYDQMLSDAESLLGKRVRSFGVGRFRFNDTAGARPRLMIESNNAIIELNKVARNNDVWAVCSLAHEMVHVLNPKTGGATVLEEGLACHFALLECDKYMPGNRKDAESWSTNEYKLALDAVAPIVIDIRKVKIMRVRGL